MNNKGFIQIKILTVVFIIGILAFTLIPRGITSYNNRKREEYIKVVKEYVEEVKTSVDSLKYKQLPKNNEALLVKFSNIKGKKSPYGAFDEEYSYVIVLNKGSYYDYYVACIDKSNRGIPVVAEKELNLDSIVYGRSQLTNINEVTTIKNLLVEDTVYKESSLSKENDNNILLIPISSGNDLTVPYEFTKDVNKVYDKVVKSIDTDIYNKEVTINNGVIRYNHEVLGYTSKDINGMFRYLSFPNGENKLYYSSFVSYNKSYVAGVINESNDYKASSIVFDTTPTIVTAKSAKVVMEENTPYLMWNMMAIYPDNKNYTISECGALVVKNNNVTDIQIDFNTPDVLVGKSNNNCELGNIFAIRKDNIHENDHFFARGYIKYKDKSGKEYITYSKNTISALVKY